MLNNYPPGAAGDPSAPYNEVEQPLMTFDVSISSSLSKSTTVKTNNYRYNYLGDEGLPDEILTEDTDWADEYHANDHYTPIQLISLFRQCLSQLQSCGSSFKSPKWDEHLMRECEGWTEDECEIIEDN